MCSHVTALPATTLWHPIGWTKASMQTIKTDFRSALKMILITFHLDSISNISALMATWCELDYQMKPQNKGMNKMMFNFFCWIDLFMDFQPIFMKIDLTPEFVTFFICFSSCTVGNAEAINTDLLRLRRGKSQQKYHYLKSASWI